MDNPNELAVKPVGKLLLEFSVPAIVGMLVNALYSIIDRVFVGRGVGSLALSGVAVTFPISNIIMAFGMLVGTGAAAVVSIKLGQHKEHQAEKILGNAFTLVIIMSIFVSVVGLVFLEPLLKVLGASHETMPYAKQFATIILIGVILQNIGFGLNQIIRSEGNPKIAMMTMLIGAILNFIMNPIFIFVLKFGVRGSALATIVSQTVCSVWVLQYFTSGKSTLKLHKKNMRLEKSVIREIVAIGMSPFAMQLAASLVTVTFNKSLESYGGDLAIGAFSLINSINMLILMPVFGINQGAQPIIGYNYGAKNIKRVKKALMYAIMAAVCISTIGFLLVEIFPVQIIRIFNTSDTKLINIGSTGIRIFLAMLPVVGFQVVCSNYFQAVSKAKKSMFLALLRQVVLLVPLILTLPNLFQNNGWNGLIGVWVAGPVSDFGAALLTLFFILHEMKTIKSFEKKEEAAI